MKLYSLKLEHLRFKLLQPSLVQFNLRLLLKDYLRNIMEH